MKIETRNQLGQFKPRNYQLPIFDAIENKRYKRVLAIWPRRAGKDIVGWHIIIRAALRRIGVYYYVFPTYGQARKVLWDSITIDGRRFVDFIPKELIKNINNSDMKITLLNGSLIQLIGSDTYDQSLVGTNPVGLVFSEYALQDPQAYQFVRPILAANEGWALFLSTPRGKNFLWEMLQIAQQNPDWYVSKLTVEDTHHITLHDIEKEKADGMSEDMIRQEFYCDFSLGVEGAYYSKYIDKLRLNGQITTVPWESAFKVYTAWDLGVRDSTTIIFFQIIGVTIRIIDCYENSKHGLEHYIEVVDAKPYSYAKHIAPHDIKVREFGSGITRIEKARQLGVKFTVADDISIIDGIEAVRSNFSKMWIDERNCSALVKALENYRQEFDSKRKIYKPHPLHNFASHFADCMRYLCVSLPKTRDGLTSEDIDRNYQEAYYGDQVGLPRVFRDYY